MTTERFFKGCNTTEEVKRRYKELCKIHHPDKGGDVEIMKEINSQYANAIKSAAYKYTTTSQEFEEEVSDANEYKEVIDAIINLDGITIELVGTWIWVSGNTKPHKDILKANKFFWAWNKKMWYFRTEENRSFNRRSMYMGDIRNKYGSQVIKKKDSAIKRLLKKFF